MKKRLEAEYLIALTQKFDLGIIFTLNLEDKGISNLGDVDQCNSLIFLNASCNKIDDIKGLEKC